MKRIARASFIAMVLATPVFAQTLTIRNNTTIVTTSATNEEKPDTTPRIIVEIKPQESIDTKLPANGNTYNYVQLSQEGVNIAGSPFTLVNVLTATIHTNCSPSDTVSPCVDFTPASTSDPDAVKAANVFLAQRSRTVEVCLPGILNTLDARYFTLANGLVVYLIGNIGELPSSGPACLCGVVATPPEPQKTITFDVRKECSKPNRERMKKN